MRRKLQAMWHLPTDCALYQDVCPQSFHKGILRKCDHCQTLLTCLHSLTVLPPIAPSPHSCCHNGGPTWQINRNYKMRSGPSDQRSNSQTRHNRYNWTRHHWRFCSLYQDPVISSDQRSNSRTRHNCYNRTRHHRRFWPLVCCITGDLTFSYQWRLCIQLKCSTKK